MRQTTLSFAVILSIIISTLPGYAATSGYFYDSLNRLVQTTENNHSTKYVYDNVGNLLNVISIEPASLITPLDGTTLSSTTQMFVWSDVGADQYLLEIGSSVGGNNISAIESTITSASIFGLPSDGSTIYVRIWSIIGSAKLFRDYIFTSYLN